MMLPLRVFAMPVAAMPLVVLVCVVPVPASVVAARQRQPKHNITTAVIKALDGVVVCQRLLRWHMP